MTAEVVTRCPHGCGWTYVGPGDRGEAAIPAHLERMHGGRDPRQNGHPSLEALEKLDRGEPQRPADAPAPRPSRGRPWTQDAAIAAVQAWAAEHGRPPVSQELAGEALPNVGAARRLFGTFAGMIEAAGFPRPHRGGYTPPRPAVNGRAAAPAVREAPPPASTSLTIEQLTDGEKLDGWRDLLLAEADRCERRAAAYRVIEGGLAMLDEAGR